jgi:hypothetical protein
MIDEADDLQEGCPRPTGQQQIRREKLKSVYGRMRARSRLGNFAICDLFLL